MYRGTISYKDFSIQFVSTPELAQRAFQLRYEVLTEELGRLQYANHSEQTYSDALDQSKSHIILAEHSGAPVGTLRFTLRSQTAFLDEDELIFSDFLGEHKSCECALADRGAILKPFRKAQLYPVMWSYGFDFARAQGIRFVLGVIDANNALLNAFHERQGWTALHEPLVENGNVWVPIVKELHPEGELA
jgi:hypothetical protein